MGAAKKVKWEKYEKYKTTDIEWLEEVPEKWNLRKLKTISKINVNSLLDSTDGYFEFDYVDIGNVTYESGVVGVERFIFRNAPSRARRIAKINDTIISTVRTYLKAIDFICKEKSDYVYSTGFAILQPIVGHVCPKYLNSFVKSSVFTNQVDMDSKGMSYPAINSTDLSNLLVIVPPLPEQTAIANFLDDKTTKIDEAISQKERLIALLKERKQILIQQAVTKGLDPNVKMKDSGIDWIGEIPQHWDVVANRILFKERKDPGREGLPLLSVSIHSAVSSEELNEEDNSQGRI